MRKERTRTEVGAVDTGPTHAELSDTDYRALAEFRHSLRVFLRFSEEAARSAGLTPNQHQLLLAVRAARSAPSVSELADRLQLRPNSTLELVRRAETARLVESHEDATDNRRQLVSITPRGAEVLEGLSQLHRDELLRFRTRARDLLEPLE